MNSSLSFIDILSDPLTYRATRDYICGKFAPQPMKNIRIFSGFRIAIDGWTLNLRPPRRRIWPSQQDEHVDAPANRGPPRPSLKQHGAYSDVSRYSPSGRQLVHDLDRSTHQGLGHGLFCWTARAHRHRIPQRAQTPPEPAGMVTTPGRTPSLQRILARWRGRGLSPASR